MDWFPLNTDKAPPNCIKGAWHEALSAEHKGVAVFETRTGQAYIDGWITLASVKDAEALLARHGRKTAGRYTKEQLMEMRK